MRDPRTCRVCTNPLTKRSDARFCSHRCAAEASLLRSILDSDDPRYGSVHDYLRRARRYVLEEHEPPAA